jgi:hypothetical protein
MSETPCQLVIGHERTLGMVEEALKTISSDVSYIRERVDNGLSTKVANIDKVLSDSIASEKVRAAELAAENWFGRILSGSASKIIGLVIVFVIINAMVGSGLSIFLKEKYSQEIPGQQKEILQKQVAIQASLADYHSHAMKDGKVLFHAGDLMKPAWLLDQSAGLWIKAPQMREESK